MTMATARSATPKALSFAVANAVSSTGPTVLVLADTDVVSTSVLATSLTNAGAQVTVRPAPEYTWDGTNPSLSGFDVVIHLNGATYDFQLSSAAQSALTSFVQNGGGYVGARWGGYESQPDLTNLVLQDMGFDPTGPEQNCGACQVTYEKLPAGEGHALLAGIPASFTFTADANDAGPQVTFGSDPSTVLMQVSTGGPAVLIRPFGAGRVVNFSFAPNYPWDDLGNVHDPVTLQDPNVQQLYNNAVEWAAGSSSGTAQPQSITFGPLADKVYGDAFSISATASSNLPVSFTATGDCGVLGTSVTITAAGTCTITAHQAGNDDYTAAEDVSRSFAIAKAPATLSVGSPVTTFDGTVKAVSASTNPAGLSGVSVSYSRDGGSIAGPVNAGVYQVLATLDNSNYTAAPANGTLTINPASPSIQWSPAPLTAGTAIGPAQLNATATGVANAALTGTWVYTPPAGTVLSIGTYTLAVQFTPSDANYTTKASTASLTVRSAITFTGFLPPVKNMPSINGGSAGSTIPIKFTLVGYSGSQVLYAGSPTSVQVQCGAPDIAMGTTGSTVGTLQSVSNSFTYMWKTNSGWSGTCRRFILTLVDGSTHQALFRFTPAPRGQAAKRK
jgi:hypothetical protein